MTSPSRAIDETYRANAKRAPTEADALFNICD
jgi:hypothetical protein